jgi:hypothetical protein
MEDGKKFSAINPTAPIIYVNQPCVFLYWLVCLLVFVTMKKEINQPQIMAADQEGVLKLDRFLIGILIVSVYW